VKKAPRPDSKTASELEPAAENLKVGEDLPAVSREVEAGWEKALASGLKPRMLRALQRVAGGATLREAADSEGYSSHTDLFRYAKRFGIVDVRTRRLIGINRDIARLSGEELVERLATDPDKVSTHALGVLNGISIDKILASEKVTTDDGSSYLSALEKMAAGFVESGVGLELRVQISPAAPKADAAIDVTPTRTG